MKFPDLPVKLSKKYVDTVRLGGINYSDNYSDGELSHSRNVSIRRFPYLSVRNGRVRQQRQGQYYQNAVAIGTFEKLVVAEEDTRQIGASTVDGYQLYYDGYPVTGGFTTVKPDQFVQIGTKIVVWPNKTYIDITTGVPFIGALIASTIVTATFGYDNFTTSADMTDFNPGDGIKVTANATEYWCVISSIETSGGVTTVKMTADKVFQELSGATFETSVLRDVPDMSFICHFNNRLFGCDATGKHIYASALGSPQNWNVFEGVSTDAWTVDIATPGPFTGCIAMSSSVLFFKEEKLHKLYGAYPAEFTVNTYDVEGLRSGCEKSMQIINEVLFYTGLHGVYSYSGGTPQLLSEKLGNIDIRNAVAGNDGKNYYVSFFDGTSWQMVSFNTKYGMWVEEDDTHALGFARIGRDLYMLTSEKYIWMLDSDTEDAEIEWYAQLVPMYETMDGKKRHSKMVFRVEMPEGSYIIPQVRYDDGLWIDCGLIRAEPEKVLALVPITIALQRCDKFQVRLTGKGPCTVMSILREYTIGSDK